MSRTKMRKTARDKLENMTPQERSKAVRSISCRETMTDANWVFANDTMADVLDDLTQNNWDHVFVVNKEGVPMGRIHAVDVLKIVAKKNVERSVAWMLSVPAKQLINLPPLTVKSNTPLLKAGALMLTHDLNQVAVVNQQGVLVGVVGHNTMAKNLPRFIL
ncbi:MAG: CBS domain-containing protein [Euryarchaeota archaeon]|nr:CBS domain-containing protein [Euryarchaeota archaeon]MBT7987180.1 CBS domain-containing protein [Euryarchaeota archaeon]